MKLLNHLLALLLFFSLATFNVDSFAQTAVDQAKAPSGAKTELPEYLRTGNPKSIEDVKRFQDHIQTLLKKIRPATVNVGGGTGVVVSKDGLILTAQHVNRTAGRRVRVVFPDGKRANAVTLGGYTGVDGGMMKITDEGEYPFVEMGKSQPLKSGEWCLALGYPVTHSAAKEPPVRLGRILGNSSTVIRTDCTIMGGDSGGPLFDLDGKVIGIHSRVNGNLTRNIHVPIDVFTKKENWDRMLAKEVWSNRGSRSAPAMAYLGVRRDEDETRALVSEVIDNSAAKRAGLKVGDLITEFGGTKIDSFEQLLREIAKKKPRDRVKIKVQRDGKEVELQARLGTRPAG